MQTLFSELEAAMEDEITPKVLDILVEIAEISINNGDPEFAVEILTLALNYPMRVETLERADSLFSALQTELCPRVLLDAQDQAQRMTLEDMVAHVLKEAAE